MRFDCKLVSLFLSVITLVVEATPPACILECVNYYARWCPNRHTDIGCFYKNSDNFIECLTTKCHSFDFEAARDHFLGVCLELLSNPPPPPPQLIKPPSSEAPSPTTHPVKHKPPKYGHRKPKTTSLLSDVVVTTGTETQLVGTPSSSKEAKDESEMPIKIESDHISPNTEEASKEALTNDQGGENFKSVEDKRDFNQGVLTKPTSNNKQMANPYQPFVKTPKKKISQVEEDNRVNLNEEISNIAIEIENEANAQSLPTFNRKKPYGRHLPDFSKKKLVNRIPTDQAMGNAKVRSHLKQN